MLPPLPIVNPRTIITTVSLHSTRTDQEFQGNVKTEITADNSESLGFWILNTSKHSD
jgi:hypothetical protein